MVPLFSTKSLILDDSLLGPVPACSRPCSRSWRAEEKMEVLSSAWGAEGEDGVFLSLLPVLGGRGEDGEVVLGGME